MPACGGPGRLPDQELRQGPGPGPHLGDAAANEPGAAAEVRPVPHLLPPHRGPAHGTAALRRDPAEVVGHQPDPGGAGPDRRAGRRGGELLAPGRGPGPGPGEGLPRAGGILLSFKASHTDVR